MTFTITAHDKTANQWEGSHCFRFVMETEGDEPRAGCVTLRTAQLLVREVPRSTGMAGMLRAIVAAVPKDYQSLVGQWFVDS